MSLTIGPQRLSAAALSPNSVHLTWVTPCHTQQYHIYYKGTCGAYVDEGGLDIDRQEHTFDGLQEGINYTFTVTQTGFSGGRILSTGLVHARTFTTGSEINTVMSVNILAGKSSSASYLLPERKHDVCPLASMQLPNTRLGEDKQLTFAVILIWCSPNSSW